MPTQGPDSPSESSSGGGTTPPFESSPFADWREQLRERVQAIRERKLADKRAGDGLRPDDDTASAAAGRERKLRDARERAAAASRPIEPVAPAETPAVVEAPPETGPASEATPAEEAAAKRAAPETGSTRSPRSSVPETEPTVDEAEPQDADEVAAAALEALERLRSDVRGDHAEDAGVVAADDDESPEAMASDQDEDAGAMVADHDEPLGTEPLEAEASEDEEEIVWEDEVEDIESLELADDADTPDPKWATETATATDEDEAADLDVAAERDTRSPEAPEGTANERTPGDTDTSGERGDMDPERRTADRPSRAKTEGSSGIPAWARPDAGRSEEGPAREPDPPDLDAIPEDMKDVPIPTWAIPRRTSQQKATAEPPSEADPGSRSGSGSAPETRAAPDTESVAETASAPETGSAPEAAATPEATATSEPVRAREDEPDSAPAADPTPVDEAEEAPANADRKAPEATASKAVPQRRPSSLDLFGMQEDEEEAESKPTAEKTPDAPKAAAEEDVYLVGEYRAGAGSRPSSEAEPAPGPEPRERGHTFDDDPFADDPLADVAFERPGAGSSDADGDEEEAIPNLYDTEEDDGIEDGPAPFRGLFESREEAADARNGGGARSADAVDTPEPDSVTRLEAREEDPARGPNDVATGPDAADPALEWDLDDVEEKEEEPPKTVDASAPVSDRIFSSLADGLVAAVLALVLGFAGARAAGTEILAFVTSAPIPFVGAWLIFVFAYGVFFIGTCGQTLGKMALRVRVIGADHFQVGYLTAASRAFWYALAALPAGLGLLPALSDPEHRTLHDRLSGTRVVKA